MSESTHVKMPHCWKFHALAHLIWNIDTVQLVVHLYKLTNFKDMWEGATYGTTMPLDITKNMVSITVGRGTRQFNDRDNAKMRKGPLYA